MRVDQISSPVQLSRNSQSVESAEQDFKKILDKAVASREDKQLMDAARQFEAMFVFQMFQQMRQTVEKGGLIEESMGEKIFQGMLDQEISEKAAETGSLGLAELIYGQLKTE